MTKVYKRILDLKKKYKLTWDQIAERAGIPESSWMTGLPTCQPTDDELRAIAPVLHTTFEWLKYGTK